MNRFNYRPRGRNGGINTPEVRKFPWQALFILALSVALVVSLVISIPSADYRKETRDLLIGRMQSECDAAMNAAKMLSRTISSNSNAQLASVRSSLYSMDVVNQTYAALENGRYPISPNAFANLYAVIDSYYSALATGAQTTDAMASLTAQLEALQSAAAELN